MLPTMLGAGGANGHLRCYQWSTTVLQKAINSATSQSWDAAGGALPKIIDDATIVYIFFATNSLCFATLVQKRLLQGLRRAPSDRSFFFLSLGEPLTKQNGVEGRGFASMK
jgi:hypothetical protein